ncbi:P-loop containing nucleoside triphosphate hydrolase protein, partial [Neoconidiobolus thromboides FSU 785]
MEIPDANLALDALAYLITIAELTPIIRDYFRPILLELTLRTLLIQQNQTPFLKIERLALMFSQLIPSLPQVNSLLIQFLTSSPSLLDQYSEVTIDTIDILLQNETKTQKLLKSLNVLLKLTLSFSDLSKYWNLSLLYLFSSSKHLTVASCSIRILQLAYNLSEQDLLTIIDNETYYHSQLILLQEQEELSKNRQISSDSKSLWNLNEISLYLSKNVINIGNVLMLKHDLQETTESLIGTETTIKNLEEIALALSMGSPVLLEGETGVGKTALIEEIARSVGKRDLIKIHLGDQTDSKALLGTYVTTSTPGQFRWQMGVLTRAVKYGLWVLIEDIDLAPQEVISVITPLLESRTLFISNRGERLVAKDGFQLFATRRIASTSNLHSASYRQLPGGTLWTKVWINSLTKSELQQVIDERFPLLSKLSGEIVEAYEIMKEVYIHPESLNLSIAKLGRAITTRDLIKWCTRMSNLLQSTNQRLDFPLNDTIKEEFFSEAVDCFCGMISDFEVWTKVLYVLGDALNINAQRVEYYFKSYVPSLIDNMDNTFKIGRVNLTRYPGAEELTLSSKSSRQPFALTKHALRLLERLSVCVHLNEPVLLVGETGTGKTTVVQHLAREMNQKLLVVNLSQQSDSSDFLGGFKPVDSKAVALPIYEAFEDLFKATFSATSNVKFLTVAQKVFRKKKWNKLIQLFNSSIQEVAKFNKANKDGEQVKSSRTISNELIEKWEKFEVTVHEFEAQVDKLDNKLLFSFIEGSLVKAIKRGHWVLLDEINLASTETLECLSGLLQDASGSILLTEKGDSEVLKRHPNFRVFACMNPATDVGKRDLPPGLRNRFTEFYTHSPDSIQEDLISIVKGYLSGLTYGDENSVMDVVEFYQTAKELTKARKIADGANQTPHYSIRTLSRSLTYVSHIINIYGLRRSLYEGFSMTFSTQLNREGEKLMSELIYRHLLNNVKNTRQLLSQIPKLDNTNNNFVNFGAFWLPKGNEPIAENAGDHYIITPSVKNNLSNLARVVMSSRYPVLIQGPTSSGKTSMIEYLAKCTGHKFIRINNHEHTDLQEYIGSYISKDGKLIFEEGALVKALRNGHWIVLDELNLAPSDVLEALNRLLDDNRELLISETQEIVKPHPHFMLFATQNPAGLYGGRKALSRAFRNRFLELHFDDIPEEELETIISQRCKIAPSYCKKLILVYKKLQLRRQSTRVFESKEGFITLRDLFRWANRQAVGYDQLAADGYMLLAERVRKPEEKEIVREVIEEVMKVKLNEDELYNCDQLEEYQQYQNLNLEDNTIAWTKAMKRLFYLVANCLKHKEPILLVGETGCGKTTVCQMLALALNQKLSILNCHQNTETSDLLGGQRPLRNKEQFSQKQLINKCYQSKSLFEWHDGPLVQAMKQGDLFLLDEISLAEDSVLERLNSVLEPERLLVLAEKSTEIVEELYGNEKFKFLATMNPGGDFGKKELSPALRNRFTEIWVPTVKDEEDLIQIIQERLKLFTKKEANTIAINMLKFINWFTITLNSNSNSNQLFSLRDILSWAGFIEKCYKTIQDINLAFIHGGSLVFLDGLGSNSSMSSMHIENPKVIQELRQKCLIQLITIYKDINQVLHYYNSLLINNQTQFGIGPFTITKGNSIVKEIDFTLTAPTTFDNMRRVLRALQISKPIMLEGSPGVGKTSLIQALADLSCKPLVRINLSEQTDLMDLFGTDLPVEGGKSGEFAWRDAPFLQAMQKGWWVLLDEINLASQSVLEGLNSCLDHRGTVFIPELDKSFEQSMEFKVFAAQNPLQQGGGRKGLPKSFVNRFTQVYVEPLQFTDLCLICYQSFPNVEKELIDNMLRFNFELHLQTMVKGQFGRLGAPWEFNLRDVFRWLQLITKSNNSLINNKINYLPNDFFNLIYLQRMRCQSDRDRVINLYQQYFKDYNLKEYSIQPNVTINSKYIQIGNSILKRNPTSLLTLSKQNLLHTQLTIMESLMKCIEMNWMSILIGNQGSGKTKCIRWLANQTNNKLVEFSMNLGVDTMELLGGFEQMESARYIQLLKDRLLDSIKQTREFIVNNQDNQNKMKYHFLMLLNNIEYQLNLFNWETNNQETIISFIDNIKLIINNIRKKSLVDEDEFLLVNKTLESLIKLMNESTGGRFEWIEGPLIEAMEKGYWFLIDNANLCHASVLDRLNPLLETNGNLMLHERGLDSNGNIQFCQPHSNFRIFLAMDSSYGELSRPMRNRGIEINFINEMEWSSNEFDLNNVANLIGSFNSHQIQKLIKTHHQILCYQNNQHELQFIYGKPREFSFLCQWIMERMQRG